MVNQLMCNKFGDKYKCYLVNNDKSKPCFQVKGEGIDKIFLIGEFPNAIVSIGRSSGDFTIPDLMIHGEINCDIFESKEIKDNKEIKEISLSCHKI
jgi:hypothetical protein